MTTFLFHTNAQPFEPRQAWAKKESSTLDESPPTTRSNTPDSGHRERFTWDNTSDRDSIEESLTPKEKVSPTSRYTYVGAESCENNFEIDVCPKRKKFNTSEERRLFVEEYKRKYKTELCKNWELRGTCKFGDKCCFAHGRNELKGKMVTHTKYKTKPCKQYYQTGYCPYGQRCQYLHREALQPNILFNPNEKCPMDPSHAYEILHELNRLSGIDCGLESVLDKLPKRNRLAVFEKVCVDL